MVFPSSYNTMPRALKPTLCPLPPSFPHPRPALLLQPLVAMALLECVSLLMDRLAELCVPVRDLPPAAQLSPCSALLLAHNGAVCIVRRLETMRRALDAVAGGSHHQDAAYAEMMEMYASCLVQVGS